MGLDSIQLLISVEEKFSVRFPDDESAKIHTVGDFADALFLKMQEKTNTIEQQTSLSLETVQKILIDFISDWTDIPVDKIALNHSITNDLGID